MTYQNVHLLLIFILVLHRSGLIHKVIRLEVKLVQHNLVYSSASYFSFTYII